MSIINKIQQDLRRGGAENRPENGAPSGTIQKVFYNKFILTVICVFITIGLLVFIYVPQSAHKAEEPVSSTAKDSTPQRETPVATLSDVASPPAKQKIADNVRQMPSKEILAERGSAAPTGTTDKQLAAQQGVFTPNLPLSAQTEPDPPRPVKGRQDSVQGYLTHGSQDGNVLTEEEARYTPPRFFASAEQAYAGGKRALVVENNPELAIKYLQQALTLDRGHLASRELLAEIYHKVLRRHKEALALLREGVGVAPDHKDFSKKYAMILAERGDYAAAATALLQSGLPNIKNDQEALELLAALYLKLDEPYLAAQTYRHLLIAWPDNGGYWFSLGSALEMQQKIGEAIGCYKKTLETSSLQRELFDKANQRIKELVRPPS